MEKENSLNTMWSQTKEYLTLKLEYTKLTAAEKLTVALSTAAIALVLLMLAVVMLFFFSLGLAFWLGQCVGMAASYAIFGVVYLVAIILVVVFRKQLIINPVARFITRLVLK